MSLCQKAGQWQRAMQVFREMEAVDVRIDVVAYNSAIAACAKGEDWEQAWAVFNSKSWLCLIDSKEKTRKGKESEGQHRKEQKRKGYKVMLLGVITGAFVTWEPL